MTEDQKTQTTDSNDNIVEQELESIIGGCFSVCPAITAIATKDAGASLVRAAQHSSPEDLTKGLAYAGVALKAANGIPRSLSNVGQHLIPCQNGLEAAFQHQVIKSFPPTPGERAEAAARSM